MSVSSRIVRKLRTVLITFATLVALTGIVGIAYTWYMGSTNKVAPQSLEVPTPVVPTTITPKKPSATTAESVSVQTLTSPVSLGDNAAVTVQTKPLSTCTITVTYNKIPSTDSGLVTKTADDFGIVSWSWTVGTSTPKGTWPVLVTCTYATKTAVVQGDLVVGTIATN